MEIVNVRKLFRNRTWLSHTLLSFTDSDKITEEIRESIASEESKFEITIDGNVLSSSSFENLIDTFVNRCIEENNRKIENYHKRVEEKAKEILRERFAEIQNNLIFLEEKIRELDLNLKDEVGW